MYLLMMVQQLKPRNFKVVTAPVAEPVTSSDVKLYSRVDTSIEDTLIDTWIASGRITAEDYQHRAYIAQTLELSYDYWPDTEILLPRPPAITVNSVKYYDTDNVEYTLDSSKYFVDADSTPARISLNYGESWPSVTLRPIKGLVINYDAGYGTASDVPDRIKDSIYLYCAYRYENRIAEDGTVPPAFYNILQPDRIEDR
ncbi:MAG: hypothetical protein CMF72_10195 [Mameliella sp.]|nr:hypothetical protein [Mameliella sp.]